MVRKILLICGIASSLLYVAMNILGALQWEDYSFKSQVVSELFAINAPSRPLLVPLGIAYDLLMIAFGLGVWRSAGQNRALRITGGLLVAFGVVDLSAPFFPMHMRGEERALTDSMHIVLTMVDVLLVLAAMGFGAAVFGKRFRLYSNATILILLVFGALTGWDGPRIAANLPTPWVGVTERINIGVFLL
jgi:hypothetical protein